MLFYLSLHEMDQRASRRLRCKQPITPNPTIASIFRLPLPITIPNGLPERLSILPLPVKERARDYVVHRSDYSSRLSSFKAATKDLSMISPCTDFVPLFFFLNRQQKINSSEYVCEPQRKLQKRKRPSQCPTMLAHYAMNSDLEVKFDSRVFSISRPCSLTPLRSSVHMSMVSNNASMYCELFIA